MLQGRVTDDYQPGNDQWKIGVTSIFAHALGVAPYKDNHWTTTNQTGNLYSEFARCGVVTSSWSLFVVTIVYTISMSLFVHKQ